MAGIPDPRREFVIRVAAIAGAAVSLVALAVAASRQPDAKLVRARHEIPSPSGNFVAKVEVVRGESGTGWRPVVLDQSRHVVYRSEHVFADNPTPRITWESGLDTLWISSATGGLSFVQEGLQGWTSTTLDDADSHLAPAEARG